MGHFPCHLLRFILYELTAIACGQLFTGDETTGLSVSSPCFLRPLIVRIWGIVGRGDGDLGWNMWYGGDDLGLNKYSGSVTNLSGNDMKGILGVFG